MKNKFIICILHKMHLLSFCDCLRLIILCDTTSYVSFFLLPILENFSYCIIILGVNLESLKFVIVQEYIFVRHPILKSVLVVLIPIGHCNIPND